VVFCGLAFRFCGGGESDIFPPDLAAWEPQLKISCYKCDQKLDVTDLEPFVKIRCPGCSTKLHVPLPFGNLLLQEEEGSGELTKVYRSVDMTLDRQVVVKVLHPKYMHQDNVPERFVKEARAASAVSHPNLIPIYSSGEMEGKPYIVMQYMEGGSLRDLIIAKDNRGSIEQIAGWFLDVANGLQTAATQGILHHDVTPSNLFLDGDGNAKVGDFGLAHIVLGDDPIASESGQLRREISKHRARSLSPERILTGKEGVQGDLFGFGAAMYEFFTDMHPFDGDTPEAIIRSRFEHLPQPVRQIRGDVPEALDRLIAKCMQVNPDDRPASYDEPIAVLKGVLDPSSKPADGKSRSGKSSTKSKGKSSRPKRKIAVSSPKPISIKSTSTPPPMRQEDGSEPAPAPIYVQPSAAWGPRIMLILVIVIVIGLLFGHVTKASWYVEHIMPLFDPTAGVED
jgi:serine/threonine-protein kinase